MLKIDKNSIINLRKLTSVSILKCKAALLKCKGDFNKALYLLNNDINIKCNNSFINKMTDSSLNEGLVIGKLNKNNTKGVLLKINCSTDFVSKNNIFLKTFNILLKKALNFNDLKTFLYSYFSDDITIIDHVNYISNILKEPINIGGFEIVQDSYVSLYNHYSNKLAVLVGFDKITNEKHKILCQNISMQVAAMNPIFINKQDIPYEFLNKHIFSIKNNIMFKNKNTSSNIINNILEGKISKLYSKIVLLEQNYIKDSKLKIKDYLNMIDEKIKINIFKRLSIN